MGVVKLDYGSMDGLKVHAEKLVANSKGVGSCNATVCDLGSTGNMGVTVGKGLA